jgi:hypothetical protein
METFVELLMLKKEDHLYFSLYDETTWPPWLKIEHRGQTAVIG